MFPIVQYILPWDYFLDISEHTCVLSRWVLVIGTRKGQDVHGNIVGQEAAKIRQLKRLGE